MLQDSDDLSDDQNCFEDWLKKRKQEVLPYLICVGEFEKSTFYVRLNGEDYPYTDCVKAVEACYKCLSALQRRTVFSDFIWSFFDRAIFNLSFRKANAFVIKFISDLDKLQIKQ